MEFKSIDKIGGILVMMNGLAMAAAGGLLAFLGASILGPLTIASFGVTVPPMIVGVLGGISIALVSLLVIYLGFEMFNGKLLESENHLIKMIAALVGFIGGGFIFGVGSILYAYVLLRQFKVLK